MSNDTCAKTPWCHVVMIITYNDLKDHSELGVF